MRVLLTIASMHSGGAERVVTTLAAGLAARGLDVALAAPHGPGDEELRDVHHERFALEPHEHGASGAMRLTLDLTGAIRRFQADVVHAQNVRYAAGARVACSLAHPRRRPRLLASTAYSQPTTAMPRGCCARATTWRASPRTCSSG